MFEYPITADEKTRVRDAAEGKFRTVGDFVSARFPRASGMARRMCRLYCMEEQRRRSIEASRRAARPMKRNYNSIRRTLIRHRRLGIPGIEIVA